MARDLRAGTALRGPLPLGKNKKEKIGKWAEKSCRVRSL